MRPKMAKSNPMMMIAVVNALLSDLGQQALDHLDHELQLGLIDLLLLRMQFWVIVAPVGRQVFSQTFQTPVKNLSLFILRQRKKVLRQHHIHLPFCDAFNSEELSCFCNALEHFLLGCLLWSFWHPLPHADRALSSQPPPFSLSHPGAAASSAREGGGRLECPDASLYH